MLMKMFIAGFMHSSLALTLQRARTTGISRNAIDNRDLNGLLTNFTTLEPRSHDALVAVKQIYILITLRIEAHCI
jgi:hypothetical protein